jgi:hypothetical protein
VRRTWKSTWPLAATRCDPQMLSSCSSTWKDLPFLHRGHTKAAKSFYHSANSGQGVTLWPSKGNDFWGYTTVTSGKTQATHLGKKRLAGTELCVCAAGTVPWTDGKWPDGRVITRPARHGHPSCYLRVASLSPDTTCRCHTGHVSHCVPRTKEGAGWCL